jgi:hypothetical protein
MVANSSDKVFLKSVEFYVPLTLSISSYNLNFSFQQLGVTSPAQTVTEQTRAIAP